MFNPISHYPPYCVRFLAVVCPVSSLTIRTIPNAQLAILLVWVVILISSTPIWLAHNLIAHSDGKCTVSLAKIQYGCF